MAVNHLSLPPLKLDAVSQLIADTLDSDLDTVRPLAQLVLRKTSGNPFFIVQFLQTLYAEHLLGFDFECLSWQWDIAQIEAMDITDNAVDLMVDKLRKLPEATQTVLQLAACVGSRFDLKPLPFAARFLWWKPSGAYYPPFRKDWCRQVPPSYMLPSRRTRMWGAIGTPATSHELRVSSQSGAAGGGCVDLRGAEARNSYPDGAVSFASPASQGAIGAHF
ncbi:MAG: hypothetical protein HC925_03755 [Coleofasciculaceae cyanobacterium SM2_3_26]|nr:hypothetical protein [Coleofasciculaceae cyanobacterium SM2_3_26]